MSITISCPHCSHKVKVPETKWAEITGKKVRCKGCKEPFELSDDCVVRTLDNSAQKAQPKPEPIKDDAAKEGENVETEKTTGEKNWEAKTTGEKNWEAKTTGEKNWATFLAICFLGVVSGVLQTGYSILFDSPRPAASRPVASRPAAPRPVAPRPVASQPAAPRQQYFDRDGELKKAAHSEAERMNNEIKTLARIQRINVVDQYNDFYSELYRRLNPETVGLSGDAFKNKCEIICGKWRLQQVQDKLR